MKKNIPIIKIPAAGIHVHQLLSKIPSTAEGYKFGLKLKIGKRYKLRAFRVKYFHTGHCECCGNYVVFSFGNSYKTKTFDTHFGSCFITPHSCI